MVGQVNLINRINKYTLSNLPQSLLLLGEKGSGKHTLSLYISEHFDLELIDITERILEEDINDYYVNPTQAFFLIDLNNMSEKEQNKLLKLVEEPPENCHLILLCNSKNLVLNTLIHRCTILQLEDYSRDELAQFTDRDVDASLFKTPGQLINFNFNTLEDTFELINKIINRLDKASFANTLTITDKFNFKDEYDKIDLYVFTNILLKRLALDYDINNSKLYKNYYLITAEFAKKLNNTRLNKQVLVDNYLTKMWRASRNDS